jgi:hypothetical protein
MIDTLIVIVCLLVAAIWLLINLCRLIIAAKSRPFWLHYILPPVLLGSGRIWINMYWSFYPNRVGFFDPAPPAWAWGSLIVALLSPGLAVIAHRLTLRGYPDLHA